MYFDGKNTESWQVIDGLQWLCTLKEFLMDKKLRLTGMEYLPDYDECLFDDLPRIYQRRIEEAQIAFYLILPDTPSDIRCSLFKRINKPGLKLEPQEIRHALYHGKATVYLKELAEDDIFQQVTDNDVPSERMQDREMVLRYFALKYLNSNVYKTNSLGIYLCKAMEFLNLQEDSFFEENRKQFFDAVDCIYKIFGKQAFRRISKNKPLEKKPFNSALFEGWTSATSALDKNEQIKMNRKN